MPLVKLLKISPNPRGFIDGLENADDEEESADESTSGHPSRKKRKKSRRSAEGEEEYQARLKPKHFNTRDVY